MMADITACKCVVIGGGAVGWRKACVLLECGAHVVVVSPEGVPQLAAAASEGRLIWERRAFETDDLSGALLVFAATNDLAVNALVRAEAKRLGVWMNAAYDAEQGDFIVPSALRRGSMLMTVTTGGASPALARRIAGEWESWYGPEYADYVDILGRLRHFILASCAADPVKRRCLSELLGMNVLERLQSGEAEADIVSGLTKWIEGQLST
jgi:precorrin-2 dehydrogenase/sirohydrochlorin ferrochelatase